MTNIPTYSQEFMPHGPDYNWIVMDRVQPISTRNNELLEEAMIATMPKLYEYAYELLSLDDGSPSMDTKKFRPIQLHCDGCLRLVCVQLTFLTATTQS